MAGAETASKLRASLHKYNNIYIDIKIFGELRRDIKTEMCLQSFCNEGVRLDLLNWVIKNILSSHAAALNVFSSLNRIVYNGNHIPTMPALIISYQIQ